VSLDGSGSSPGSGGALTYAWSQTAGPGVGLSSVSVVGPSFTAPVGPAVLTFALVVSNDAGTSVADSATVTVAAPPLSTPVNVARTATATASSQNTADGQTAAKAVDGVIDGYPNNYLAEWSTAKGKVGSWLQLVWSQAQTINRVVLYDRPNLVDQATGGTLTFSDGSTVAVGALPNDGSPLVVTFPARATTSVRFTVTSVLKGTANVGLAEIEVWTP